MHRKIDADCGVVIGRFQVDKLHVGHRELLDWVSNEHKKVIVVLGVACVTSRENPLDFQCRQQMINEIYPNIICVPLADNRSDEVWSKKLDDLISNLISPSQSIVLYGSRNSFIQHYSGKFKTQELVGNKEIWSGTEVREALKREVINSFQFRAGQIHHAYSYYPRVIPVVDVAVMKGDLLLLAKKENEKGFRFIGGYADARFDSYEDDAIREVLEETGLIVNNPKYVCSMKIDDFRHTGVDKMRTNFYIVDYVSGEHKANDDIVHCDWKDIEALTENDFIDNHKKLFVKLKEHWNKIPFVRPFGKDEKCGFNILKKYGKTTTEYDVGLRGVVVTLHSDAVISDADVINLQQDGFKKLDEKSWFVLEMV